MYCLETYFYYYFNRLIKAMVEEKETRMKETLSILGVRPLAQWLSWMITASLSSLIIAVFVTMTLSMVMRYSSTYYLFLLILLFSFATSGFGFFIASFFSRANLAAIVGPVALFVTLLPRWIFFGSNRYEAIGSKKWASLFPCTAFAFGADILSDYEYAQVGIQSSNLRDGAYSFNTTLGFLFIDTILYIVLGWYLEQVIPRQYGVAKKWYFLLTPSFWKEVFPCSKNRASHETSYNSFSEADGTVEEGTVEHVSADAQLRISNLVKIYNPKKPPAINNLNLSMYDSEITCLLGHNGAGKSSTISVLTGLYPPTSGDCIIYGKSILYDMAKCRQSMGICPQQNVLFNNLTVLEHLRFFENIKGISSNEVKDRANEVGLGDFFHTRAGQLSGGNKRKLQLAIALAGEPKLVLLDEPTSGMDPYSRRATWELLRQKRHGRVILLTTHFMDEAEVLADRVAILKDGSLQCSGSVLFLKQRFGLGYNMTIVVDKEAGDVPMATTQQEVAKLLEKSIPGTRFIRESARELVFRFPPASQSMVSELNFDDKIAVVLI
jgi:ATP-binding cassette subfamily A (ABC1) protein 3